jgi:hypothetical protein
MIARLPCITSPDWTATSQSSPGLVRALTAKKRKARVFRLSWQPPSTFSYNLQLPSASPQPHLISHHPAQSSLTSSLLLFAEPFSLHFWRYLSYSSPGHLYNPLFPFTKRDVTPEAPPPPCTAPLIHSLSTGLIITSSQPGNFLPFSSPSSAGILFRYPILAHRPAITAIRTLRSPPTIDQIATAERVSTRLFH